MEDGHEFLAGNCFFFQQVRCQAIHILAMVLQDGNGFLVGFLDEFRYFLVNPGRRGFTAGQGRIPAQISILDGFHAHHVKFFRHAQAGDHGTGQARRLLNVIGSAAGHQVEDHLFGRTAAGHRDDAVEQFFLALQDFFLLVHLHGVAQRAARTRHNRNLVDRGRIGLHGCHQGMPDFMVCNDFLFFRRNHRAFALVAGNDDFDRFFQVLLVDFVAAPCGQPAERPR
jgi:hypothetical protein